MCNKKLKKILKKKRFVPKLKLSYTVTKLSSTPLDNALQMADFARKLYDKGQMDLKEKMFLILMDLHNYPIGFVELYRGTSDRINLDDKEILMYVYKRKADKFYLVHNHPTGNIYPSEADVKHKNQSNFLMKKYCNAEITGILGASQIVSKLG